MISPLSAHGPVTVQRWPSEIPLLVLIAMFSVVVWAVLTITIIGLAYALLLGAFFFVAQALFVSHLKGNAVRVGPDQFRDLHAAVERLSRRVGLQQTPDAYVMESGGALNAFAMRFMRSKIIVLYSDLLDACGDDLGARDMIIAHELGHIRAGHLTAQWLLLPGMMIPFLGTAYSRAREYTCDRYGLAGCGDLEGALQGLTILAAGGKMGRLVNRRALARQHNDLNTGWMTIGKWMSTHPPLTERIAALDPALQSEWEGSYAGPVRALAIMVGTPVVMTVAVVGVIAVGGQLLSPLAGLLTPRAAAMEAPASPEEGELEALLRTQAPAVAAVAARGDLEVDSQASVIRAEGEMMLLARVVSWERQERRKIPADWRALVAACVAQQLCDTAPIDPFDGSEYGYVAAANHFVMFSSGPDAEPRTADDIVYDSRVGQMARGWDNSAGSPR